MPINADSGKIQRGKVKGVNKEGRVNDGGRIK